MHHPHACSVRVKKVVQAVLTTLINKFDQRSKKRRQQIHSRLKETSTSNSPKPGVGVAEKTRVTSPLSIVFLLRDRRAEEP